MKRSIAVTLLAGLILAVVPALSAAIPQWPQFRGPNGSGLAPDDKPGPVSFGTDKNVLWKTTLPPGHSSPCIWGDRIFADRRERRRQVAGDAVPEPEGRIDPLADGGASHGV